MQLQIKQLQSQVDDIDARHDLAELERKVTLKF